MRQHQRGARCACTLLTRAALAVIATAGACSVVLTPASQPVGATGVLPPSNPAVSVPPQVVPHCTYSPVNDNSVPCIDSILHDINEARSLEGLGSMVLPSSYATDSVAVQQLVLTDEER